MSLFLQIALGVLTLACVVSILIGTLRAGISPMPSSGRAAKQLLALVPPGEGPIVELGSGWGGLAVALAKAHPHRPVVAYEISTLPWLCSVGRARLARQENLSIHRRDFFLADLSEAQVVVCYLHPAGMTRLQAKLTAELAPGTTVLSNTFALHGWAPEDVVTLEDLHRTPVYRYRQGSGPKQNPEA